MLSWMIKKTLFSALLATSITSYARGDDPVEMFDNLTPYTGPGWREYQNVYKVYVDQLNVTYPDGFNPFDALVQGQILYPFGQGLGALGIYGTPDLLPLPTKCNDQAFGLDGQFTELVCTAVQKFTDICDLEPTCDSSEIPPVIAAKGEILANTGITSFVLCIAADDNPANCFDSTYVATYYGPSIQQLQFLITSPYVPGGYENPLFTNNEFTGLNSNIPNSHHVIGDSYYVLRQMTEGLDSDDKNDADVILDVLVALVDHTYVESHMGFSRTKYFKAEFLAGYYAKKYNDELFTTASLRAEVVPVAEYMRWTGCTVALGVLAGTFCGFETDEAVSFFDFYFETLAFDEIDDSTTTLDLFCSPMTEAHIDLATKVMKESSLWKPPSTETLTMEQCMETLKLPSTSCSDSPLRLKIPDTDGGFISRYCSWVAAKDVKNRCAMPGVSAACPLTCESCASCEDPSDDLRFKFEYNGKEIIRNCDFIGRIGAKVNGRCKASENICKKTCGAC